MSSSSTDVHPTAVGTNTVPDSTSSDDTSTKGQNNSEYPEQKHAGAVGYGPNFHAQPGFLDKVTSLKEQVAGKVTGNPDLVTKGHDRWTGELRQKELDADAAEDPFANPEEKDGQQPERKTSSSSSTAKADQSERTSTQEQQSERTSTAQTPSTAE
ncbi:hypothetical protein C8F01DRAFT_1163946 [Mycena amicta]|nr:hypothetical protein C8F01DRAFT_1163946 [Mycena amicta]